MEDTKTENNHQGSRVQPRRSSRSALSNSPTVKEEKNMQSSESNSTVTGAVNTSNDTTDSPTTTTTTNNSTNNTNDNTTDYNNDTNDDNNRDNNNDENDDDQNSNSNNNKDEDANDINSNNNSDNINGNNNNSNNNGNTNNHSRVTRSLSTDSNSNEESSNSNPPSSINGKRRRNANHTKIANKKKANNNNSNSNAAAKSPPRGSGDDFERETRNTTQRLSKEAKDARKAEREIIIKKKLAELDVLERTVKDQSHEEYHKLLEEIQSKRNKKLTVAQGRHALMESNFKNGFLATKKSAFDKFHLDKLALRRSMMNQIQQKINRIEQEYFSSQQGARSSLDDQHLNEWSPPDRPSMINILFYLFI